MKICHYNTSQAGAVVGNQVYPIGEALVKAGHLMSGYTMLEVIEVLANQPTAMKCARDFIQTGSSMPLGSVNLLAPIFNPPSLWAAAANYWDHQTEIRAKGGTSDRMIWGRTFKIRLTNFPMNHLLTT